MNRPVLALGKTNERPLSQPAAASGNRIDIADAPSHFAPGDLIFVAESDGTEPEFLGAAKTVAADHLTTVLWLREGKAAGAAVWRPAAAFVLPCAPSLPVKREFASGVRTARSTGGALYSVRVAEPSRADRLRFDRMLWSDFLALRAWIEAHLQDGLLDFTYVDDRGAVWRARLSEPDCAVAQADEQLAAFELPLALLGHGEYV